MPHASSGSAPLPRRRVISAVAFAGLAGAVWAVGIATRSAPGADVEAARSAVADASELHGLWRLEPPGPDGAPVHFYYFHPGGKGLYRYGVVGLTQTRSFDYAVEGDELVLHHRKLGRTHRSSVAIEGDRLVLSPDPFGQRARTVYVRDAGAGPRGAVASAVEAPGAAGVSGHMWIDVVRHATGGMAFGFYQFGPARIDGRGVGWYHAGDFDDWSTEAFTYRVRPGDIDFHFTVRDEAAHTPFVVEEGPEGRVLRLERDPRDFWAPHGYVDAGPSFGAAGDGMLLPLAVAEPAANDVELRDERPSAP